MGEVVRESVGASDAREAAPRVKAKVKVIALRQANPGKLLTATGRHDPDESSPPLSLSFFLLSSDSVSNIPPYAHSTPFLFPLFYLFASVLHSFSLSLILKHRTSWVSGHYRLHSAHAIEHC